MAALTTRSRSFTNQLHRARNASRAPNSGKGSPAQGVLLDTALWPAPGCNSRLSADGEAPVCH